MPGARPAASTRSTLNGRVLASKASRKSARCCQVRRAGAISSKSRSECGRACPVAREPNTLTVAPGNTASSRCRSSWHWARLSATAGRASAADGPCTALTARTLAQPAAAHATTSAPRSASPEPCAVQTGQWPEGSCVAFQAPTAPASKRGRQRRQLVRGHTPAGVEAHLLVRRTVLCRPVACAGGVTGLAGFILKAQDAGEKRLG